MRRLYCVLFILVMATACASLPASAQKPPSNRTDNLIFVANRDAELRHQFPDNHDILLRPGLLANRTNRTVRFWAEATGVSGSSAVEFFLIDIASGHDYEAAAVAFAKPSDIHAALEFIGIPPGQPYDPSALQFWARGERVIAHAAWQVNGKNHRVRIEHLCYDNKRKALLPAQGLIFTGSFRVPSKPATNNYAADLLSPNAIAGNFNDSSLVLDVPWQANQSENYGQIVANPDAMPPRGALLEITMEPEYRDGTKRVARLALFVAPGTNTAATSLNDLRFTLSDTSSAAEGSPILVGGNLPAVLSRFEQLTSAGRDPFVTLKFDSILPVSAAHAVAEFVASIDNVLGIRVEAPPAGIPYYKCFCPPQAFRNRLDRPSQPWELRLTTNTTAIGILSRITEHYDSAINKSTFTTLDFPIATTTELQAALARQEWPKVVFIYAPGATPCRRIELLFKAIATTHPTIYIFSD